MANENTSPKDLEVRVTELENAVQSLTQTLQPAAGTQVLIPQICAVCNHCFHCSVCFQCYTCFVCVIIVPPSRLE